MLERSRQARLWRTNPSRTGFVTAGLLACSIMRLLRKAIRLTKTSRLSHCGRPRQDGCDTRMMDGAEGIHADALLPFSARSRRIGAGDRKQVGTGIGLAICRGSLEGMGGRIMAEQRTERQPHSPEPGIAWRSERAAGGIPPPHPAARLARGAQEHPGAGARRAWAEDGCGSRGILAGHPASSSRTAGFARRAIHARLRQPLAAIFTAASGTQDVASSFRGRVVRGGMCMPRRKAG
jgi:hypothetical protein